MHQPAQHLGRTIGAIGGQPFRIKVEANLGAFDHGACRADFGLSDRPARLDAAVSPDPASRRRVPWRGEVSDASHPTWRARSLSVYRFWRDLGYAVGALSAGLIADRFGFAAAIIAIGVLTFMSGTVYFVLARDTKANI